MKVYTLISLLAVLLIMSSCKKETSEYEENIVGKWEVKGTSYLPEEMEFYNDGTFTDLNSAKAGVWFFDGDNLTIADTIGNSGTNYYVSTDYTSVSMTDNKVKMRLQTSGIIGGSTNKRVTLKRLD